jgi:hypothetical protein
MRLKRDDENLFARFICYDQAYAWLVVLAALFQFANASKCKLERSRIGRQGSAARVVPRRVSPPDGKVIARQIRISGVPLRCPSVSPFWQCLIPTLHKEVLFPVRICPRVRHAAMPARLARRHAILFSGCLFWRSSASVSSSITRAGFVRHVTDVHELSSCAALCWPGPQAMVARPRR